MNEQQLQVEGNYFIIAIHCGAIRKASYARNTGYNYAAADLVSFLDDDVSPDENILDVRVGAIKRYPDAKVFVGLTELPQPCNLWTELLCTSCNIGYFCAIAKRMVHPSWGVTANNNSTIMFKEDINQKLEEVKILTWSTISRIGTKGLAGGSL